MHAAYLLGSQSVASKLPMSQILTGISFSHFSKHLCENFHSLVASADLLLKSVLLRFLRFLRPFWIHRLAFSYSLCQLSLTTFTVGLTHPFCFFGVEVDIVRHGSQQVQLNLSPILVHWRRRPDAIAQPLKVVVALRGNKMTEGALGRWVMGWRLSWDISFLAGRTSLFLLGVSEVVHWCF